MTVGILPGILSGAAAGIEANPLYTRWRMFVRNRPSSGYIWLAELYLYEAVDDGIQAAVHGTSGTGTTSSALAGYGANLAFDNNEAGNGWSTAVITSGDTNWLEFAFNTAKTINQFKIATKGNQYAPLDFDLQYHDGTSWIVARSFLITTGDYATNKYTGLRVPA